MAYLLGVDEAGYGPNLGPLVIGATLWRVPDERAGVDLYEALRPAVVREPAEAKTADCVAVADSKLLYKPGGGLGPLERGVLASLTLYDTAPATWRGAWRRLAGDRGDEFESAPWHDGYDAQLPCDCAAGDILRASAALEKCSRAAKVELIAMRAAAVFPRQFNAAVAEHGNKSTALSRLTLVLVRDLIAPLEGAIIVRCDKHGGRDRYGPLLQTIFPEHLVEVRHEGRRQSKYAWGPPLRRVEIDFSAGGESFLPSALASMTAKYLRELAMQAFNRYWLAHLPHVKPTAGYPIDARRFKAEIEPVQRKLGIADGLLWRER